MTKKQAEMYSAISRTEKDKLSKQFSEHLDVEKFVEQIEEVFETEMKEIIKSNELRGYPKMNRTPTSKKADISYDVEPNDPITADDVAETPEELEGYTIEKEGNSYSIFKDY